MISTSYFLNDELISFNQLISTIASASTKLINFPLDLIKKYYLYESNRWDLETYQKKVVKLPVENYIKSLENFMNLQQENSFKKYKVFDYRINNQLILR